MEVRVDCVKKRRSYWEGHFRWAAEGGGEREGNLFFPVDSLVGKGSGKERSGHRSRFTAKEEEDEATVVATDRRHRTHRGMALTKYHNYFFRSTSHILKLLFL